MFMFCTSQNPKKKISLTNLKIFLKIGYAKWTLSTSLKLLVPNECGDIEERVERDKDNVK